MKALLAPVCAIAAFLALVYKIPRFRRAGRQPGLMAVCLSFASLFLAYALSVPQVSAAVDATTGLANLAAFGIQTGFVAYSAAVQSMLLLWSYPAEDAHRHIRRRMGVLVAVLLAMAALFALADIHERSQHFLAQDIGRPFVSAEALLYIAVLSVGLIGMARMSWRCAKNSGRTWLQRGLIISALGAVVHLGYCATRLIDIGVSWLHLSTASMEILIPLCAGIGSLLVVCGLTVPTWGAHVSAVVRWSAQFRTYQQLAPLWRILVAAVPDVVLAPPRSVVMDAYFTQDLGFRLYRRVIEIRDAQRALRAWNDERAMARVTARCQRAGLSRSESLALEEAAALLIALKAKAVAGEGGCPPSIDELVRRPEVSSVFPMNLVDEAAHLVRVWRAFGDPSVVHAAVAGDAPAS